jgi:hypothetical protein
MQTFVLSGILGSACLTMLHCFVGAGNVLSANVAPISADESNYTPLAQTIPASERLETVRQAASSTASAMERFFQALPKR